MSDETEVGRIFADSNLWLYAFIASQDAEKSATAKAIIEKVGLSVSTQLINEVCINLIRKAGFSEEQIRKLIEAFYERQVVVSLDKNILLRASDLRTRYRFSFWDSMMLASALTAGATIFYSEDMQDGFVVDNALRIVNPFLSQASK